MNNFEAIRKKFLAYLDARQAALATECDLRERMLSLRHEKVGLGFLGELLETGFPRNLRGFFPQAVAYDEEENRRDLVACLGLGSILPTFEGSNKGMIQLVSTVRPGSNLFFMETCFLASTTSWVDVFASRNSRDACLGYMYDDIAQYYMADYPNRLIQKLNSEEEPTREQRERAERCMAVITGNLISKYNHQSYVDLVSVVSRPQRVLVVDQSFADASLVYGRVTEQTFQEMLLAAIRENPEAEILVKTHPDSIGASRSRPGYFSGLKGYGNVRFLVDPMNPMHLLEQVDKVYVATSGMGFEALLMGKPVVCFGHPFYAGWGLTDDRQPISHRRRTRSLTELFHYFYIWYTHYHTPESNGPCEIEDVLEYILDNRPKVAGRPSGRPGGDARPKISVVVPAYNVEPYIAACLRSVQEQTLKDIEILVVDDCSLDTTLQVVEAMASLDPRIKPLRMESNSGQGFARNLALDKARGEYVWFIDSDDFIPSPDALERLYEAAVRTGADMTRGRKLWEQHETLEGAFVRDVPDKTEEYFPQEQSGLTYFSDPVLLHSRHFCLWLYKRSFLEENAIRFLTGQWEERPFLLKALLSAKSISLVPCDALRYRIRPNSTARRQKNIQDVENQLMNFSQVLSLFDDFSTPERPYAYHRQFTVSQYLHYIGLGFAMELLSERLDDPDGRKFFQSMGELCRSAGIRSAELTADPQVVNPELFAAGVYHVLFEAFKCGDLELALQAWKRMPMASREYYERLFRESDAGLAAALTNYVQANPVPLDPQLRMAAPGTLPRILLHIGATKTGSTFLQAFMETNRAELLRRGIWYPEFGIFKQAGREYKQAGHSHLMGQAISGNFEFFQRILQGLEELPCPVRTIVFSSEAFFLNPNAPEALPSYLTGFELSMIVYLRRQDEWANSQYCEFVGGGAVSKTALAPEEWLESPAAKRYLDYQALLYQWEQAIGKDRVIVRPFERSQLVCNDLLHDFLSLLDISPGEGFVTPDKALHNDFKFSEEYLKIMRHFNAFAFSPATAYLNFVKAVLRELPCQAGRKPQLLTLEQRRWLLRGARHGNAEIARRYLGKSDGVLFENTALPAELPPPSPPLGADFFSGMITLYDRYSGHRFTNQPAKKGGKAKASARKPGENKPEKDFDELYHEACRAFHQEQYALAVAFYRQAEGLAPDDMDLQRVMAEALIRTGDTDAARACLEKAAARIPQNKALKRRLLRLKHPLFRFLLKDKPFPVPVPGVV
ncbi:hypothetical protein ASZ90_001303 [hydrocarbon metagenome]|uniref:Glycosyltransferase 2-like domain-containing protein n=1 Tax=hydrocarbon metagenome TaxID=938273 RepID=A0A0W8G730_9ZZZZ